MQRGRYCRGELSSDLVEAVYGPAEHHNFFGSQVYNPACQYLFQYPGSSADISLLAQVLLQAAIGEFDEQEDFVEIV